VIRVTEMQWHPARVTTIDDHQLTLMFARPEQCQRCQAGQGCGAGLLARLFASARPSAVTVPRDQVRSEQVVQGGDWVRVGVPSALLARAAVTLYGLPLLAFVAILVVAPESWHEGATLTLALLAAATTVILGRQRRTNHWTVRIEALNLSAFNPTSA